jgi:hypothetical protein
LSAITFAIWGSRRPAPLEILRVEDTGLAELLVGCAWPYGEHLDTMGTFGRNLDSAEQAKLLELATAIETDRGGDPRLDDIVAELAVGDGDDRRISWSPPFVPQRIVPFFGAISALVRDLRNSPRAALTVAIEHEPLRLEFIHLGTEAFCFYGFNEDEIGAAVEVHLGGVTAVPDVPTLLHAPVEPISDPPDARVDPSGIVELRPGEKLVLPVPGRSGIETALIRICYPRRGDDGARFADEGWVVTGRLLDRPRGNTDGRPPRFGAADPG